MPKIQYKVKVVCNEKLSPKYYRLSLDAKPILQKIRPGQFIHIRVSDDLEPFFRRPFSVYRAQRFVEIFYEPVGPGTRKLATKRGGDVLDILGPLGNQFSLPPLGVRQVVMIGGGIGVAPFLILSDYLKPKNYEMILLYGGRTREYVFDMKEFKKNGCRVYVATDDGSVGVKGKVSRLFSKINKDPASTMIYTCGPKAMMVAVQEFARRHHLHAEASCEEVMACGLGACLGCSIRTTSGYKTVCYDGPVFDLQEVIFGNKR
jgi:dihydroorotate dehydrogenase electron transfer subunit